MIRSHETLLPPMELVEADLGEYLPDEDEQIELLTSDEQLLKELWTANRHTETFHSQETLLDYHDKGLADRVRTSYDPESLTELTDYLRSRGTLALPVLRDERFKVSVDGEPRPLTLLPATEIGKDGASHGDMSSMIYLRDQIQAATALMEVAWQDTGTYAQEAADSRGLLLSALHLMSTDPQLARQDNVIAIGNQAGQADWPNISHHFNDLEGKKPNGWRNKQDSFQMLAYLTLDALERDFISPEDLSPAHRQFLGGIVPLLTAVGFPEYESSGSWEEIESRRTSVMSVETALLAKIQKLPRDGEVFQFLKDGYDRSVDRLTDAPQDFDEQVDHMVEQGLKALGQRLPAEALKDETNPVKRRDADAALVYVLRYGIPELLAERETPMVVNDGKPMSVEAIEDVVIEKLVSLIDPDTNGIFRYLDDSYQRTNGHTNASQMVIRAIKSKVSKEAQDKGSEVDLDEKQRLRGKLTPLGMPAAWTHPLGQMGSWCAKRADQMRTIGNDGRAVHMEELGTYFINTMLTTVTGEDQYNAALGENGRYQIKPVPAFKVPECIITYEKPDGTTFRVPSPHTPLNWGTAMLLESVNLLQKSLVRKRQLVLGA